jgi:ElaB/YqjD/DUF883 family membrane-anchored ribosome-binding protein
MENSYSPTTTDQVRKTASDAERLGSDVKKDFESAAGRARSFADDAKEAARDAAGNLSGRAREIGDAARRNLGKATGRVSDYADDNTAMVAIAAFGVGLLVGHLVTRES